MNAIRSAALFCVIAVFTKPVNAGNEFDVVVYGGTSAGVAAAIQVARSGKTVVLIEPSKHVGGLTSGGLGATDIGNKRVIGGISREFYRRVRAHYAKPLSWNWQELKDYKSPRSKHPLAEDAMWTFEPSVAESIMNKWIQKSQVVVHRNERLNRKVGVKRNGLAVVSITMESGKTFHGKQFIDATYEGDLLAAANISYIVGREPNSQYGETLNGVQTKNAKHHQFVPRVDAFQVPGDKQSGLLLGIQADGPGQEGAGDHRVQAYCFRMCNTMHEANRIPFAKPKDYDEQAYELLFRNFEAGAKANPWHAIFMPNLKTDTNNNKGFSTDFIGQSYDWAEADYVTREVIFRKHLTYQQGLMWTLSNHKRVPKAVREYYSKWGNCRDEFPDFNGWPHQLYVREARRMIADVVMNQSHCEGKSVVNDPIGMAAYTMDSHNVQRYVDENGFVKNEGDVQVGGFPPYPISYRSIIAKKTECSNLSTPTCLSASHIAFGSIRMEPVFMVLAQSAAVAACHAIDAHCSLSDVDYSDLKAELKRLGQVLE